MVIELDETPEPRRADEILEDAQNGLNFTDDKSQGAEGSSQPEGDSDAEAAVEGEILDAESSAAIVSRDGFEPEALANLLTEAQIEQAVNRIVARTKAVIKFKAAILTLTNVRDWYAHAAEDDEDGIPYLAESGSEKVINAFAIEVKHDGGKKVIVEGGDGGYEFVYTGEMRARVFSDIWYPVVGSRYSEDGFFTRGGKRIPDPGDVRKAAHTNFLNRGIKTVCGLKTVTWDELEQLPGFEDLRNRVPKIGYRSTKGEGDAKPGEISDIEKGPHIKVKIDKNDLTSREAIKKLAQRDRTWNRSGFYWVVRYSKENFGRVLDLHTANEKGVTFKVFNVSDEDLPQ